MKSLSKSQQAEMDKLIDSVREKFAALENAVGDFNTALAAQRDKLTAAVDELNGAISDADGWRDTINSQQQDYFDERSEKWQEGDAGQSYDNWRQEWAEELEQVEIEMPADVEIPEVAALECLENIPCDCGAS